MWRELSIVLIVCITYLHNFDHFHKEGQLQILHSAFMLTWTAIIYNDHV
jgi:hypothetical protein